MLTGRHLGSGRLCSMMWVSADCADDDSDEPSIVCHRPPADFLAPEAFPPPAFFGELTMRWEAAGWLPMASADARCPLVW